MRDFNSSFELRFELILFVSHYKTNISFFFFFNEYRGSNYARSFSPFRGVLLHSRLCRLSSTSLGILIHMVRLIWGASPSVWSTIRKKMQKKKKKRIYYVRHFAFLYDSLLEKNKVEWFSHYHVRVLRIKHRGQRLTTQSFDSSLF